MRRVSAAKGRGFEPDDPFDVPAAVVCATCGRASCVGCAAIEPPSEASGVIAVVPWEQSGRGWWPRLWSTARLSTMSGETFFGDLSDGSLARPLAFALWSELVAIASVVGFWLAVAAIAAPWLLHGLWVTGPGRSLLVFGASAAVPAIAVLMVLLHVAWGLGLELGVRIQGRAAKPSHGLRYAFYSCGWDLVTSPIGLAAGAASGGIRGALRDFGAGVRVPRLATRAYLRGVHGLGSEEARRATWAAALLTGGLVLVGSAAAVALIVAAALAASG